jgi:hypothetical protein
MKKCGFKARPPKNAGARELAGPIPRAKMILALWLQLHEQGVCARSVDRRSPLG